MTATTKTTSANRSYLWIGLGLIGFAVFARWLPHPPNVAPIAAMALLGGAVLPRRLALSLPLIAMMISDVFIGLHSLVILTWGSFVLIALLSSFILKRRRNPALIALSSVGASSLFFVVTNFGVWLEGMLYPRTWAGLVECYTLALPFFRNTLIGDAAYTGLLFGLFYLATFAACRLVFTSKPA